MDCRAVGAQAEYANCETGCGSRLFFALNVSRFLFLPCSGISTIGSGSIGSSDFRAGGIHFLSPVGELNQTPSEFRWEAFTGANSYTIELRDAIGTVLGSTQTKKNVRITPTA